MRRERAEHGGLADPQVDHRNTARLKEIIHGGGGFPGTSLVGDDGANAAWLIVQHASADRPFQVRGLALIRGAVDAGEASPRSYAYLLDRVRLSGQEPQVYGTQYRVAADGRITCREIEDPQGVDARRHSVALEPLRAYLTVAAALSPARTTLGFRGPNVQLTDVSPTLTRARITETGRTAAVDVEWDPVALCCRVLPETAREGESQA